MVSEIAVYGRLALSFWAYGKAAHHGGECVMEQATQPVMAGSREREKELAFVAYPLCQEQ